MDWCVHYISTNSHPHPHWHPHPHPPTRMQKTKSKMRNKWKVQREQNCSKLLSRMAQTSMFLLRSSPSLSFSPYLSLSFISPAPTNENISKIKQLSLGTMEHGTRPIVPAIDVFLLPNPDPRSRIQSQEQMRDRRRVCWGGVGGAYSGFAWFNQ